MNARPPLSAATEDASEDAADQQQLANAPPDTVRPRASSAMVVLARLAIGATLWAAQGLVLPVLLAMFFALIGNPIIRSLQRLWVPHFLGALLVLLGGLAATLWLGSQLIQPAGGESTSKPVQGVKTEVNDPYKTLTATPRLLALVLLTFFFMVYGDSLQRNAVALLPTRQQKRLTVGILQSIEHEISRYVLTISIINAMVGLVFAGALYLLKVPLPEALLWGTMAAILNFALYVGPLIGIIIMLLMDFVAFDDWNALVPAGIYLALHTLEGQFLTPIVLGRQMRLSPLILILALMVFG